jgi:thiol-disulfide isomerase/thioredoxin
MVAMIGSRAPNLKVSEWIQGKPTNIDKESGNVVFVEVFQVNCPGCFIYGIPQAVNFYNKYLDEGLTVIGLATAFEDYDKNNISNLKLLLSSGEVIGETRNALSQLGRLIEGKKLSYNIPFAIAMDSLRNHTAALSGSKVMDFIEANIPDFRAYSDNDRAILVERVKQYLKEKRYSAETFEEYRLRGTPSSILIDRKGILRHTNFGANHFLEDMLKTLLNE